MEKNSNNRIKTKFDGKRIKVTGDLHPRFNSTAICMGADKTGIGYGLVFKCEKTNEEFFAFDGNDVTWIDK